MCKLMHQIGQEEEKGSYDDSCRFRRARCDYSRALVCIWQFLDLPITIENLL